MSGKTELLPCPFCGGEANTLHRPHVIDWRYSVGCNDDECRGFIGLSWLYKTEAEAIAAWNSRTELGSKPPYDELLRCLENDWNIRASWDGLRKFWCVELTEEGVKLRDAARAERTCEFKPFRGPISDTDEEGERHGICSVCSAYMHEQFCFCPNCGCKVVDA